jgi:polyisoprenoid-binding protein YceI
MQKLGPDNATLSVRTTRDGAAAKAGHDLLIHVTAWEATLSDASLEVTADPASLRVIEGTGGMMALDVGDRDNIHATIDKEVLERKEIAFRSTEMERADGRLHFQGDLTIAGQTHPISFDVTVGDGGALSGSAVVKQSDWGIKPYSTLFGALKVSDDVTVAIEADPGAQSR